MSKIIHFLVEAATYVVASAYFYTKVFLKQAKQILLYILKKKIKLDIHTFAGVLLLVIYFMIFTGKIEGFHGFHDALPVLAESSGLHGGGGIVMMATASVVLLLFGRGVFVLFGYITLFYLYVVLASFETPQSISIQMYESRNQIMYLCYL